MKRIKVLEQTVQYNSEKQNQELLNEGKEIALKLSQSQQINKQNNTLIKDLKMNVIH